MTKHQQTRSATAKTAAAAAARHPQRRGDPVALPLKKPVKMSGVAIAHAENLLVRIEAADGTVGWGEAASAPTMTGDTQGGLVAAVRASGAAADRSEWMDPAAAPSTAARGADGQHRRAFGDRDGAARSRRTRGRCAARRARRRRRARFRCAHVAARQCDASRRTLPRRSAKTAEGFHFFKLKVATKPLEHDIAATHAVREALGPEPCPSAPTPIAASRSRRRSAMWRPHARPGCCSSSSRSEPPILRPRRRSRRASPVADRRR